jgi:hypothetical protein
LVKAEGDASKEEKENMANHNGAKGAFNIFGDCNSSASTEKGGDGG